MRTKPSLIPLGVLGASLSLTVVATIFISASVEQRDRARFANSVQSTQDRITSRLDTYIAMLRGGTGLFAAQDTVTREEFREYVHQLDVTRYYPGIQGLGWAVRLAPEDTAKLGAALRTDGFPEARVWPTSPREEYFAIQYLEPLDRRNRIALGYDMFSEPVRREAMERARDTGLPAMSGPITLVQEISGPVQPGFLIYVPVYRTRSTPPTLEARRAELAGFVYAPFRAGDLFLGIFGTETEPRVSFRVYDGDEPNENRLLYDSNPQRSSRRRPAFTTTNHVEFAGRTWTLVFTSLPALEATSGRPLVPAFLVSGIIASLLLFAVTRSQVRARAAAERSDAMRSRFFAAMSHELRTPINAIIGYNDLLLAGAYGPLPEEQRKGIERSQRAARHLHELVNDVLDLSRFEAGKVRLELEEVRVSDMIDELLSTVRPMAEQHGSELRVSTEGCEVSIVTDPRRVRQVLLNLLSNAARFGQGKPIDIRCAPRRDGIAIEVVDRGPGIAPADLPRVFEEFVQLPGGPPGGTGLGLPISRSLARLLGGRLEVDSAPGRGSTFRLVLPIRAPAADDGART